MAKTQYSLLGRRDSKRSLMAEHGVKEGEIHNDVLKLPDDVKAVMILRLGLTTGMVLSISETAKALGITTREAEQRYDQAIEVLRPKYLQRPRTHKGRVRQALGLDPVEA